MAKRIAILLCGRHKMFGICKDRIMSEFDKLSAHGIEYDVYAHVWNDDFDKISQKMLGKALHGVRDTLVTEEERVTEAKQYILDRIKPLKNPATVDKLLQDCVTTRSNYAEIVHQWAADLINPDLKLDAITDPMLYISYISQITSIQQALQLAVSQGIHYDAIIKWRYDLIPHVNADKFAENISPVDDIINFQAFDPREFSKLCDYFFIVNHATAERLAEGLIDEFKLRMFESVKYQIAHPEYSVFENIMYRTMLGLKIKARSTPESAINSIICRPGANPNSSIEQLHYYNEHVWPNRGLPWELRIKK